MIEAHVTDLLPAYALGALDDEDLLQVARHLPGCPACRAELAAFLQTVDELALAAPPHTPPPGLRAKVVGAVIERAQGSGAEQRVPAERSVPVEQIVPGQQRLREDRHREGQSRRGAGIWEQIRAAFGPRSGWALGALALAALLFLGINNLLLWQRVNALQARVPGGNMRVVQLTGTENAPQAVGYLMVFPGDQYGSLTVDNAPVLDPGHQYQIWLVRDGKRSSGGVFSVNKDGYGVLKVSAGTPLDTFQTFGITIEPAGGSPGPTGKKILGGGL